MEDKAQELVIASLPYAVKSEEDKRDAMRQYKKQWRDANKANIKIYRLAYMEKNNNLTRCDLCGGEYKKYGRSLHHTTTKHRSVEKVMEMQATIKSLESKLKDAIPAS
jgi:hypothetical protein